MTDEINKAIVISYADSSIYTGGGGKGGVEGVFFSLKLHKSIKIERLPLAP